jgi:hypothetical protein
VLVVGLGLLGVASFYMYVLGNGTAEEAIQAALEPMIVSGVLAAIVVITEHCIAIAATTMLSMGA